MSALFFLLLLASFVPAIYLLIANLPRCRARLRRREARRTLGYCQLVIGVLWICWGALYLRQHGRGAGGWYAIVLGALWSIQALRRIR